MISIQIEDSSIQGGELKCYPFIPNIENSHHIGSFEVIILILS